MTLADYGPAPFSARDATHEVIEFPGPIPL
jgi:hypothetical protein